MRALVTGCAGFIGSHLAESLLADGHTVLGIDCFNDNYGRAPKLANLARARDYEGFEFVPVDLARGDLLDLVAECEVIFHLAAEPGVRSSWGDRFELFVRNNVLATQRLLEAAAVERPRRVVYASSSSIYGNAESLPDSRGGRARPFSPYGVTKLAGEHLCRAVSREPRRRDGDAALLHRLRPSPAARHGAASLLRGGARGRADHAVRRR